MIQEAMHKYKLSNFILGLLFILNYLVFVFSINLITLNILIFALTILFFPRLNKKYVSIIIFLILFKLIQFTVLRSFDDLLDILRFSVIIYFINFLETNYKKINLKFLKVLNYINIVFVLLFISVYLFNYFPTLNESIFTVIISDLGLVEYTNQTKIAFYFVFCIYLAYLFYGKKILNLLYILLLILLLAISFKIIYILAFILALVCVIFFNTKNSIRLGNLTVIIPLLIFIFFGHFFSNELFDVATSFRGRIWYSAYLDFQNSHILNKIFGLGYSYVPISETPFSYPVSEQYTSMHSAYFRFFMYNGYAGLILLFIYINIIFSTLKKLNKIHLFFFLFYLISSISDGSILSRINDITFLVVLLFIAFHFHNLEIKKNP
jgi:hypothetical protein